MAGPVPLVDITRAVQEIEYAYRILEEGSSADRQVRQFEQTGSLKDVVDLLVRETRLGVVE